MKYSNLVVFSLSVHSRPCFHACCHICDLKYVQNKSLNGSETLHFHMLTQKSIHKVEMYNIYDLSYLFLSFSFRNTYTPTQMNENAPAVI